MSAKHLSTAIIAIAMMAFAMPQASAVKPSNGLSRMKSEFANPPAEARPRVWWHWEDGNITKDGIRKDLEWMHRIGIAGYHHFDAGTPQTPVVENRMIYMHEDWKDAFRYAISLSDSLGMSVGIASSPGWSNTGGPWVKKENAMKRLVWSSVDAECGPLTAQLPRPYAREGWYKDIMVVAMKLPVTGAGYRSITVLEPEKRNNWGMRSYTVGMKLECSDNGTDYTTVAMIPPSSAPSITVNFPEKCNAFFRVVKSDGSVLPESKYVLHKSTRVEHGEDKAGFSSPYDLHSFETVLPEGEQTASVADVVDISACMAADGTLEWNVPDGRWRILRFGYTLTGKKNGPAPKEATGLEVDKLDKKAYHDYFIEYLNMYKDATQGLIGSRGITELLVDSYEAWWQTWTPDMIREFELKRGYSLLPWMPALTGEILESAQATEQFLFDWRRTISDLYYENYAQIKDIAAEYGIKNLFLESQENGRVFVADGMDIKRHATVPMSACWTNGTRSARPVYESDMRESSSVAHLYGRRWVATESFTKNGLDGNALWDTPQRLKRLADSEFACGVNRIFIHESSHQPLDDCRPGVGLGKYGQWFSRHETWAEQAKVWIDYLARSSYLLSLGENVADVLVYYGEDINVTGKYARDRFTLPAGYNFDFINSRGLDELKVEDGTIVAPSGARYKILCIDADGLPQSGEAAKSLERLEAAGARICKAGDIDSALAKAVDKDLDGAPELRFVHRRTDDCDIYWVNNHTDKAVSTVLSLRCSEGTPTLWNPENGKVTRLGFSTGDGRINVPLEFGADDAVFVVCSKSRVQAEKPGGRKPSGKQNLELNEWTLQFPERTVKVDSLACFTSFDDEYLKYFSGTCTYTTTVCLDKRPAAAVLDLGQVCDLCELIINGTYAGTLWRAPFRQDIGTLLRKGTNTIEVKVVNTWVNRLIGDTQPDCPEVTTYTSTKFYKADSPLQKAGLLGPAVLSL